MELGAILFRRSKRRASLLFGIYLGELVTFCELVELSLVCIEPDSDFEESILVIKERGLAHDANWRASGVSRIVGRWKVHFGNSS